MAEAARVAARSQLAAIGAHAVDQAAVEVADFERQLLLLRRTSLPAQASRSVSD